MYVLERVFLREGNRPAPGSWMENGNAVISLLFFGRWWHSAVTIAKTPLTSAQVTFPFGGELFFCV